jgi:hypothetical protein
MSIVSRPGLPLYVCDANVSRVAMAADLHQPLQHISVPFTVIGYACNNNG